MPDRKPPYPFWSAGTRITGPLPTLTVSGGDTLHILLTLDEGVFSILSPSNAAYLWLSWPVASGAGPMYSYTWPAPGGEDWAPVPSDEIPSGSQWTADIHNHPAAITNPNAENFSKSIDIQGYRDAGVNGYLITPTWDFKKYENPAPFKGPYGKCGCP